MYKTYLSLSALFAGSIGVGLQAEQKGQDLVERPNGLMNMRPGLLPPEGTLWRGATMENNKAGGIFEGGWSEGVDPYQFEDYYK